MIYRLFGPCDSSQPKTFKHDDCAFFNTLTGDFCSCSCHTPSNIRTRVARLKSYRVLPSDDLALIEEATVKAEEGI